MNILRFSILDCSTASSNVIQFTVDVDSWFLTCALLVTKALPSITDSSKISENPSVLYFLGNLSEAQLAYSESLAIARQLRERLGDAPESLRDLSVSLNRVGDLARDLGNLSQAREALRESLLINRRLAAAFPERSEYQLAVQATEQSLNELESAEAPC